LINTPSRKIVMMCWKATFGVLPESQQNFPRLVQLAAKLYF